MRVDVNGVNGAKIVINTAPFADVMTLKSAIQRELASSNIKLDLGNISLEQEVDIVAIVKTIMQIDSSKEVFEALFKCLARCVYDGQKITEQLFEKDEPRQDYYLIQFECIKANLKPFLQGLVSSLPALMSSLNKAKS
jgi:hypothetical protein